MNTSLGFHTFSIYMRLTGEDSYKLYHDFLNYDEVYYRTNPIARMRHETEYGFSRRLPTYSSTYFNIEYHESVQEDKGLRWVLRYSRTSPVFRKDGDVDDKPCSIKATINLKILLGLDDYITAADSSCLKDLIEVFNHEAGKISPILRDFHSYSLNRLDYCVNFDLAELGITCIPDTYMILAKRSDIPHDYVEFKEYDEVDKSHRKKPGTGSYYLMSRSAHINCYDKNYQLEKQYPMTPYIGNSRNVVRFEIQCKYLKVQYLQRKIKACEDLKDLEDIMAVMLSDESCTNLLKSYYRKTIGCGDYYVLDGARDKIKSMKFNQKKEKKLIDALNLVSQCRGVFKAKSQFASRELKELKEFKRTLNDLGEIGINPVTIPRELRIKFLPNLMQAYLAQREEQEAALAAAYPKKMRE